MLEARPLGTTLLKFLLDLGVPRAYWNNLIIILISVSPARTCLQASARRRTEQNDVARRRRQVIQSRRRRRRRPQASESTRIVVRRSTQVWEPSRRQRQRRVQVPERSSHTFKVRLALFSIYLSWCRSYKKFQRKIWLRWNIDQSEKLKLIVWLIWLVSAFVESSSMLELCL